MNIFDGIVEDIADPLRVGRVRVRVFGKHTDDKNLIPTSSLPWASVLQTATASLSGIGKSAGRLLRGSWVKVVFVDPDCQYPLVLGSIHGIPASPITTKATNEELYQYTNGVLVSSDGTPVTDSSGTPVQSGSTETVVPKGVKRAKDYTSVSWKCVELILTSEGFRANAYLDPVGIPTIGYGTVYYPDGTKVKLGDTITKVKAAEYVTDSINKTYLPRVQKVITSPVTQSMVDALVSLVYNLGSLKKTSNLVTDLNACKYELAASRFTDYNKAKGQVLAGLTFRREKEKKVFLSDGIPNALGELDEFNSIPDPVIPGNPIDPEVVFEPEAETNKIIGERGFSDPSGKYPTYRNEPDTNRLARHERITETSVYRKEIMRDKNVPIAGSDKTWNQSPPPYNAMYPFNDVHCSESGHLLEFDDTPNSRRINLQHASGTFIEVDNNGTLVNQIIGDGYHIYERNGFVHIKGTLNVTVDSAYNLRVLGKTNIEIDGETTINVYNNVKLNVSGDLQTVVGGNHREYVKGEYSLKVDGDIALDGANIHLNSGKATALEPPKSVRTPETVELSELMVVTRGTESAMHYETPEEGIPPAAYEATRIKTGEANIEELKEEVKESESESVSVPVTVPDVTGNCDLINQMKEFPPNLELSRHYTLGAFNKNGARPIIQQMGLKPHEIVCNLKMLAIKCLDIVRDTYPHIIITSGFRRPGDAANSSATSRHYYGEAVDIQFPGFSRKEVLEAVKVIATKIPFDQLILEYEGKSTVWVHISYKSIGNRKQIFTMNNHKRVGDFGKLTLVE